MAKKGSLAKRAHLRPNLLRGTCLIPTHRHFGCFANKKINHRFSRWFIWRRRRDSNSRASFLAYALSRGASSTKLEYFSMPAIKGITPILLCTLILQGSGGKGRIRTHGALPPNGFQDRLLRPLGHLSKNRVLSHNSTLQDELSIFFRKYFFVFFSLVLFAQNLSCAAVLCFKKTKTKFTSHQFCLFGIGWPIKHESVF